MRAGRTEPHEIWARINLGAKNQVRSQRNVQINLSTNHLTDEQIPSGFPVGSRRLGWRRHHSRVGPVISAPRGLRVPTAKLGGAATEHAPCRSLRRRKAVDPILRPRTDQLHRPARPPSPPQSRRPPWALYLSSGLSSGPLAELMELISRRLITDETYPPGAAGLFTGAATRGRRRRAAGLGKPGRVVLSKLTGNLGGRMGG